jgi:hypothetical protein
MSATNLIPLTEVDVRHHEQFAGYVKSSGHLVDQKILRVLYALWGSFNRKLFDGKLTIEPHIILSEPKTPRAYGDHGVSGWGSPDQIRIRPSLLRGTHRAVRPGDEYKKGRLRLVADILLHEMIHQYLEGVLKVDERSYHGHGPAFRDECNRIGGILGLPPVRSAKRRGRDKALPSCAQWPINVRPLDYYRSAFLPTRGGDSPGSDVQDDDPDAGHGSGMLGGEQPRELGAEDDRRRAAENFLTLAALVYGHVASREERENVYRTLAALPRDGGYWLERLREAALTLSLVISTGASERRSVNRPVDV